MIAQLIAHVIALHMGGVPEAAMFLGPILLIIAFVRIARRNDANAVDDEDDEDDEDDWDADLGDLRDVAEPDGEPSGSSPRRPGRS